MKKFLLLSIFSALAVCGHASGLTVSLNNQLDRPITLTYVYCSESNNTCDSSSLIKSAPINANGSLKLNVASDQILSIVKSESADGAFQGVYGGTSSPNITCSLHGSFSMPTINFKKLFSDSIQCSPSFSAVANKK